MSDRESCPHYINYNTAHGLNLKTNIRTTGAGGRRGWKTQGKDTKKYEYLYKYKFKSNRLALYIKERQRH